MLVEALLLLEPCCKRASRFLCCLVFRVKLLFRRVSLESVRVADLVLGFHALPNEWVMSE